MVTITVSLLVASKKAKNSLTANLSNYLNITFLYLQTNTTETYEHQFSNSNSNYSFKIQNLPFVLIYYAGFPFKF